MEVGDGNPWRSSPKCLQIPSAWRSRVLHVDIAGDMPQSAANLVVAVFPRAPCLQCCTLTVPGYRALKSDCLTQLAV